MNTIALKRLTDSIDAVIQITNSKSIGPITLLRGLGPEACSISQIEVTVDVADNIDALTSILQYQLATPGAHSVIDESYRFSPLHWPFAIIANRSGVSVRHEGITTMIGERGISGRLEGLLSFEEVVLIEFLNAPEDPFYRAEVCYRNHNIYGFVPHESTWSKSRTTLQDVGTGETAHDA